MTWIDIFFERKREKKMKQEEHFIYVKVMLLPRFSFLLFCPIVLVLIE